MLVSVSNRCSDHKFFTYFFTRRYSFGIIAITMFFGVWYWLDVCVWY